MKNISNDSNQCNTVKISITNAKSNNNNNHNIRSVVKFCGYVRLLFSDTFFDSFVKGVDILFDIGT